MNRSCLFVLVLAAAGCADTGDESFIIRNNLAVTGTSCMLNATTSADFQSRGQISTSSPTPYLLTPLIESRLTADPGQESLRTVMLMGAKVDLAIGPITVEDATGVVFSCAAEGANACFSESELSALAAAGTTKFRSLFSAPLSPNKGLTSAAFDLVPTAALREIQRKAGTIAAGAHLHAQIVATAQVYGDLNGNEVEGVPFVYPVTACNDCVVNVVGTCAATSKTFKPRPGNACNPFQDGTVDCCSNGADLVCPAVGTGP